MSDTIGQLAHLNEIDLAVDALKARLHEIADGLREPAALTAARRAAADAEAALNRAHTAQRDRELAQQEVADKLKRAEDKLYGSKSRSSREVESEQLDVQQLRHQFADAEERLLETMLAADEAAQQETAARAELARLTEAFQAQQVALTREQSQIRAQAPALLARQAAARKAIAPALLAVYDNLRPRRGGRAVARVDGDECSACKVAIPPSKLSEVRSEGVLVYCGNCGRLLWEG
jgi:uncharacterized protein